MAVKLSINGTPLSFDVVPATPLFYVLRDNLALHGA
jgi:aerobic-type carbon monoxide dehydrogenase small subunit (CoxS/CutS family)